MLKTIKKLIAASLLLSLFAAPLLVPAVASADDIQDSLCQGASFDVGGGSDCTESTDGANDKINGLIKTVITIFSLVVGVVSVIMIIIGGLKYITSSGDSNNVQSAKNTILYAIIGLVIVALAQVIVKFVLGKAISGSE